MPDFINNHLTTIILNLLAFIFLIYSIIKSRDKTKEALKIAFKTLVKILPVIIIIVIFIGFMVGFLPTGIISRIVGEQAGFFGVLVTAVLGSILFIPSLISFPIAASLLDEGATIVSVSAFITTLTMVGVITIPLEVREMGKKITVLRNIFSFIFAILIALIMEIIL